jgi:hypothetical protein
MQHQSPLESRLEYFPPTPPLSDSETPDKAPDGDMANLVPHTAGQTTGSKPGTSRAPSRITLSLGNLPSKKDFKAPWPRTPSKVRLAQSNPSQEIHVLVFDFRSTLTTLHGPRIAVTMSIHLPMPPWVFAFLPFSGRRSKTPSGP